MKPQIGTTIERLLEYINNLPTEGGSGAGITAKTVTLSASGWSNNTQTVFVEGVTANNVVQVAPSGDRTAYLDADIYCSAQGAGTLTFTCETTPTADIAVNVLIMG